MSVRTYIIAEAGVNHNGSLQMAKQLIDAALEAGADAVKFQSFKTENEISRHAPKAEYQTVSTDKEESQFDMVKKLELNQEAHAELIAYCKQEGIEFLSTPFDHESAAMLTDYFRLKTVKIPSGEVVNAPLLLQIARTGVDIILSTGMCTLGEVESALAVLAFGYMGQNGLPTTDHFMKAYYSSEGQRLLQEKVTLLHCTTEYPTPFDDVNLRVIDTFAQAFGLKTGLSDHTDGIAIPIAAVARGARVIEKHFTLDRRLPGPDHQASLEPSDLKRMIEGIRQTEAAIGRSVKVPAASEQKNLGIVRKSLVASVPIRKGELFSEYNLTAKRPGTGVSPMRYWEYLGISANRDYEEDEVIDPHALGT
ncbi:N-acetylneuraminate synthase [Cohnella pontilimi]|uniref:N-acetylneuraminate synthase n=1 Tax=Cohnella pontilimi TaxID=2564100 RepID=A0A4U0FAW6_9BACL|nr:N-acetylneuraminate synthase [Cohnella pontilimi]TJY41963.1 N-acetylneuraminate synthase [Cohnella pontilimi]